MDKKKESRIESLSALARKVKIRFSNHNFFGIFKFQVYIVMF